MNIKIKKYEICDINIPKELSGYRMALFSDVHNAYYGDNGEILLDKIDEIKPDVVLFAGDGNCTTHNCQNPKFGHDNFISTFLNIAKKYELFYVPGNHEHRWKAICDKACSNEYEDAIKKFNDHNIHYIINSSLLISDGKINLIGLDLPKSFYESNYETLTVSKIKNLVGSPKDGLYNILLTHTPIFFPEYVSWGANLTLSGHMHGGMIRLPLVGGLLSPYRTFFPKYDYGLYENDGAKMIVSSGAGDHNIRFKLSNPYEIVQIVLKHKE